MAEQIGILTGGGDAPGLNAVIRGVVCRAEQLGYEVIGFLEGWKGLLEKHTRPLTSKDVEGIQRCGGTILGSSRTNAKKDDRPQKCFDNLNSLGIEYLIAAGGDDTLGVAHVLCEKGAKAVGVPKTIDNDLSATDYTFGFDTAINRVMECLDWLHTTAESHRRVMVVEIMGRHAGWMTLFGGIAGDAHLILVPEQPFTVDAVCGFIRDRKLKGYNYTLIAVAEGASPEDYEGFVTLTDEERQGAVLDDFGNVYLKGIGAALAKEIRSRLGEDFEVRDALLGHLQRGGRPSAADRVLGTRMGVRAAELIHEGKFGRMVSLRGTEIVDVPLSDGVGERKLCSQDLCDFAKIFYTGNWK